MLSLETARKLKEAGLQWELQIGDWYSYPDGKPALIAFQSQLKEYIQIVSPEYPQGRLMTISELLQENAIWLPRLDQLLAEIEKRGYYYHIIYNNHPMEIAAGYAKYWCILHDKDDEDELRWRVVFRKNDDVINEAVGQALLWILKPKQEKGE